MYGNPIAPSFYLILLAYLNSFEFWAQVGKDYQDMLNLVDDMLTVTYFQDGRLTAGGGATEIELAQQLAAWGETHPGLEQYSIGK